MLSGERGKQTPEHHTQQSVLIELKAELSSTLAKPIYF
jgi:hypothetical protein